MVFGSGRDHFQESLKAQKGSRKKIGIFFSGPATKWGEAVGKGVATKKKLFFILFPI